MKSLVIAITILVILLGFTTHSLNKDLFMPEEEKIVNLILYKSAEIIEKKYKLIASGDGASMPGGALKQVSLSFDTKDSSSRNQLRDLLIKCSNELLSQINMNEEIRKFMVNDPFTIENIQIIIFNNDKEGREVLDPLIATAEISGGILMYRTVDPEDHFKFKNEYKEIYEEALKLLSNPK